MLLAGAITSIYNIINKTDVLTALKRLLIVLIIFYIIGLIVKAIFMAAVVKFAKKAEDETSNAEAEPEEQKLEAGTMAQDKAGKQAGKA